MGVFFAGLRTPSYSVTRRYRSEVCSKWDI